MKVCMLAYTFYESDNRVRRYAETLVEQGAEVDVISLKKSASEASCSVLNGVNNFRVQKRVHDEKGKLDFIVRLSLFFIRSMIFLAKKQFSSPYDVIHVHNMPDFLVFAALIPKIKKAKIIFDIHDLFPEFFLSKFKKTEKSPFYKILILLEKACIRFSDHTIIANHIWEKNLLGRAVTREKLTTIMNYPDNRIFSVKRQRHDDKFIMLYPGSLNWHQGLDVAIKAFSIVNKQVPEAEFHIYGEGPSKESLINLVSQLNLERKVLFKACLPLHEIANAIVDADLGVVPKVARSFGNEAFSTKIFEFMVLGVPVIVSDTKIDKYYFNDSLVKFFRSEDEQDLADSMLLVIKNKEFRNSLISNASEYMKQNNWAVKEKEYLDIIDKLTCEYGEKNSCDTAKQ